MLKVSKNTILIFFVFFLVTSVQAIAQEKSNLEVINNLLEKSVTSIALNNKDITSKKYIFQFVGANDYSILETELIKMLQKKGFTIYRFNKNVIADSNKKISNRLVYTLENVKVIYKSVFKDGFLGKYLVKREAFVNGNYFKENKDKIGKVNEFSFTSVDTVLYDDIKNLDNIAYRFTSAELPEEPFFSSLLEPIIAIGTAAIAVYLFFNIRSK